MKANELMVGDFIRTTYNQKLIKVREIKQSCIYTIDNGYEYNEIEPIPITPEILEKNGWEKRPTGYVFYTDGKRYDNSLWYIFGSNTFVVNTAEFQIKYVHQLQHALRLCGINHEIIL